MNRFILLFTIISVLFIEKSAAQTNAGSVGTTVVTRHKLWLYNNKGKIAGDRDSTISKAYFNCKWVEIQSDGVFGPKAKIMCLLQGKERPAAVYYLPGTKLSPEIITGIKGWEQGGVIRFIAEEINEETGAKEMRILTFILQ